MGEDKQTFTDPKSGEVIESTWLARWGPQVSGGFISGLVCGLLFALLFGLGGEVVRYADEGGQLWLGIGGLLFGLACAVIGAVGCGLFYSLVLPSMEVVQNDRITRWAHDSIARTQHRRRILRSQEDQDVPDTALSHAQPPGEPQPTDAALSIADDPDEPGHLTVEIEEHTEDQVPVSQ